MIDTGDVGILYSKDYPGGVEAGVQQKVLLPEGNEITFYIFNGDDDFMGEFIVLESHIMDVYNAEALEADDRLCYVRWIEFTGNSNNNSHISTLPPRSRRSMSSNSYTNMNTNTNVSNDWGGGKRSTRHRRTKRKSTLRKKKKTRTRKV
jgi:hypothetical protein